MLPLWKATTTAFRAWLAVRGPVAVPELFVNARGTHEPLGGRLRAATPSTKRRSKMFFAAEKAGFATCFEALSTIPDYVLYPLASLVIPAKCAK